MFASESRARSAALLAAAALVLPLLAAVNASPAAAVEPKQDPKLCGVEAAGFTYFPAAGETPATVSYGVVLRNKTAKTAVKLGVTVNFYDASGKLVQTEARVPGLDYLVAREAIRGGDSELDAKATIASMKVFAVCAPQSRKGSFQQQPPLPRHVSFTGAVTALEPAAYSPSKVEGTYKNTRRRPLGATPGYVLRNAQGVVVGGGFLGTGVFDDVPQGVEVLWDSRNQGSYPVGTKVEGSVGFWGGIYP